MQVIEIQTLIDITDTKVNRLRNGMQKEHDQFRNFTTLRQCAEIRANIFFDSDPSVETKDIKDLGFGTSYKGKQKVWTFRFSPERMGSYVDGNQEIGALINDVHEVPIIKNLTETINMDKAVFDVKGPTTRNTIIKAIQGTI